MKTEDYGCTYQTKHLSKRMQKNDILYYIC